MRKVAQKQAAGAELGVNLEYRARTRFTATGAGGSTTAQFTVNVAGTAGAVTITECPCGTNGWSSG